MVYVLFKHERKLSDSDDLIAKLDAPRKAAPATPRHQLQFPDVEDMPIARAAAWKPLVHTHKHERTMRHEPANPQPTVHHCVREHPHLWRDAVLHAKLESDA